MASWPNLSLVSQNIITNNSILSPNPPVLPPHPVLGVPPPNMGPPPFPLPLQMAFPYQPFSVPPPYNAGLPRPNIHFYPPPIHDIQNNDINVNKTKDQFESLKNHLKIKYEHMVDVPKKVSGEIKISTFKRKVMRCFNLIRELEGQANCLQITHKTLPDKEWTLKCKEIENIKAEISNLMITLNPENIKEMLKLIKKRGKKLQYRKRKRKEWQELKREAKLNSENENRRIDLWLEKMKDKVARGKREEDIKKEADMVLADVTTKKAEAKRMLNLLNSLAKLRAARVQNLPGSQSTTDAGSVVFNEVIDRLKKMWLDQIKGYNMEEQGLKVMLEHAEEERISVEAAEFRRNLTSWNRVILGSSNAGLSQSLEEFMQNRQDWDSFIRADDTLLSSSIPIGWVIPSQPSSEEWKMFLK